MGLWGAAQGIAFGLGGFGGTLMIDVARSVMATPEQAYALTFGVEASLFIASALLAMRLAPSISAATARAHPLSSLAGQLRNA